MYAQVEKSKENKSRAVADAATQKKSNVKQSFGFIDNRAVSIAQRKMQSITNSSLFQLIQKKGKKSKKSKNKELEPRNVKMGEITEDDLPQSQDSVQEYLASIAPTDGPIREYIDQNASDNGGLCAGWVVLHRNDPKKLIDIWEKVTEKIESEDNTNLGVKDTPKAVEMYVRAHHYFAIDEENRDNFTGPDSTVLDTANVASDLPETDQMKKVSRKISGVKPGTIYDTGYEIMNSGNYSKKKVFVEIYAYGHTAQMQFASGKLQSICETEYAGVIECTQPNKAEKILTNSFFTMMKEKEDLDENTKVSDVTFTLNFDIHVY